MAKAIIWAAMSFTFRPGQYSQRSALYYQVGQMMAAGVPLSVALDQLERRPPARAYRQPLQGVRLDIDNGFTFSEALRRQGSWIPAFDLALLEASEQSGRLDACFRLLADYYAERGRTLRQMVGDFIYPAVLLHMAVFLFPFPTLFLTGNWTAYLAQTLGILLPAYAAVALVVWAGQSSRGPKWRASLESLLARVPVLGNALRSLALSRLSAALEGLLSAGVSIVQAWELAAAASGSVALNRTVLAWRPLVDAGHTPAEVLASSREFPELFVNQYASGEMSGKLDDTLRRLHLYYQEEGTRQVRLVATWVPRLFYFGVLFLVAYRILAFYSDYFRKIGEAGGF